MRQKSKAIISFILSLILCFSFFPSTVYAADYHNLDGIVYVSPGSTDSPTSFVRYELTSYPSTAVDKNYWSKVGYFDVSFSTSINANANDKVTFKLDVSFLIGSYELGYDFPCYIRISGINNAGDDVYITYASNNEPCNYTYDSENQCFYCEVTVPEDLTCLWFDVAFIPYDVSKSNSNIGFTFKSLDINVESEQTGFFNSIKEFFQQLFDKLTSGLDNIGTWFSELGNKLSNFFSDLVSNIKEQFTNMIDNLKSFFSDVGEWFSEIGDRIGSFFTELWENITIKVEGITESIREWWQSVVDFFRSLFVPEDGFFDKYKEDWEAWARLHFALLYDVKDVFDGFFDAFNASGTPDDYITIPEIKLPFLNNKTIVPETRFDLTDFIHSSDTIYYIYQLFQIIVTCLGFFLIVKYCMATFSKIITGDDDTL